MLRDHPLLGATIGDYRILSLLAHGGMSEVFRAEHLGLRRLVALKVLTPLLAENPGFRERFLRESRLAASIDHPNIVPIHEAGEDGDLLFIAMRLVEGMDLRGLMEQEGALEPSRTADIVAQAAAALDAAHGRKLIHRDVKPGNMLIQPSDGSGERERVFLSDFGLSRHLSSATRYTETGDLVGTINYVAPEQIQGGDVDARADVYSLGCVAFECLTGGPPYRSDSDVGVLWGHVQGRIPLVVERRADLPEEVDDVIAGALAKSPNARYPTAGRLAKALQAALGVQGGRRVPRRRPVVIPRAPGRVAESRRDPILRIARVAMIAAAIAITVPAVIVLGRVAGGSGPGRGEVTAPSAPGGPSDIRPDSPSRQADLPQEGGQRQGPSGKPASGPAGAVEDPAAVAAPVDSGEGVVSGTARTVYRPYRIASVPLEGSIDCRPEENIGCVEVQARPGETQLGILILDDNGATVRAVIRENIDDDPVYERELGEVCVRTHEPLSITPGATLKIILRTGSCADGRTSAPTGGTISLLFERPE